MYTNLLKTHYSRILLQDSCLKHRKKNIGNLPKIQHLSLQLDLGNNQPILGLIMVEVLSLQKPSLTQNKKSQVHKNLKKGEVVGCKLTLRNLPAYNFLQGFVLEGLPSISHTKNTLGQKHSLAIKVRDNFVREDSLALHIYLEPIKTLDVVIQTKDGSPDFLQGFRIPA